MRKAIITIITACLSLALFASGTHSRQDKIKPKTAAKKTDAKSGRHRVAPRWWESASALLRVTLRQSQFIQLSLDPAKAAAQLDQFKAQGFTVIEIFAPPEGGKNYGGLDAINRYRIDPALGTMDDFRRLVRLAHDRGLAIISFDNLGYCSTDAPEFIKACDDVRAGRDSREARRFLWSENKDAPPPPGNSFFMLPGQSGKWEMSQRAGRYYWAKWRGVDLAGKGVRLPQYNWADEEWQAEAERVVRFWMDTGIDGMVIDAVNWYVNYDWQINCRLTDTIASYGNAFIQPEGAGAFKDDPVAWITEGGWNCVQDYGLGIWWEKGNNVVRNTIEAGDPRPIEAALRSYHDRVVAAGGVLYQMPATFNEPDKQHLAVAVLAAVGDILLYGEERSPKQVDAEATRLFNLKREHRALHNLGLRRKLPTRADDKHYAFLRTAADGSERLLVVMNFQPTPQTVEVDLSGVAARELKDLSDGSVAPHSHTFKAELPAFGYRFYQVQ
jgi:hypothetical protein